MTDAEKQTLAQRAGRVPLATYVRNLVLSGDSVAPRQTKGHAPPDHEALARVLALLGRSDIAVNLSKLARAADIGVLPVTSETESEIRQACAAVMAMRHDLMRALGLGRGAGS